MFTIPRIVIDRFFLFNGHNSVYSRFFHFFSFCALINQFASTNYWCLFSFLWFNCSCILYTNKKLNRFTFSTFLQSFDTVGMFLLVFMVVIVRTFFLKPTLRLIEIIFAFLIAFSTFCHRFFRLLPRNCRLVFSKTQQNVKELEKCLFVTIFFHLT